LLHLAQGLGGQVRDFKHVCTLCEAGNRTTVHLERPLGMNGNERIVVRWHQ
jgi:hypothetical protein